jgi:DhnA family fructose-bisphosphate aldolase class Ia
MSTPFLAADGKAVIVALDHARADGVIQGLRDPRAVIDAASAGGADGLLTTFGVLKRFGRELAGRLPVILRLDGGPSRYREDWLAYTQWRQLYSVEDAGALGADAVVVMAFLGSAVELDTLAIVARVAGECRQAGLPLMVEALPCPGDRVPDPQAAGPLRDAARIAFEHGADLVKTYYTGSPDEFRTVTEACPVPVLVAGGARLDTARDTLEVAAGSMAGGAAGVVFGRNIFQTTDPAGMVRALRALVHDNASASSALEELESESPLVSEAP